MSWNNYSKITCEHCLKEFYECIINNHKIKCIRNKQKDEEKFKYSIINVDYVICPICNKKFKEINNDHLKLHNLTKEAFDVMYPGNKRISEKSLEKKNHYKTLTPNMSKKLKYSHTKECYVEKHGVEDGTKLFNEHLSKYKRNRSLEYYIERHGVDLGKELFDKHNKAKVCTLEKFIKKYGIEEGTKKFEEHKNLSRTKNTLEFYIKKHGNIIGTEKWFEKNKKISKANERIPKELKGKFKCYYNEVIKYTKLSMKLFNLKNSNLLHNNRSHSIDHKVSKYYGFINNIPAYIIGSIYNLEVLESPKNASKQESNSLDPNELINMVENDKFYNLIKYEYEKQKNICTIPDHEKYTNIISEVFKKYNTISK
jgi:hypothetical protein